MSVRYVYLLRNPETKHIIRYVIGLYALPMSVDELFKLMQNKMPIAKPYRFQIGVNIIKDDKSQIIWHKKIYTMGTVYNNKIYNLDGKVYNFTENDIVISPAFFNIFSKNTGNLLTKSK